MKHILIFSISIGLLSINSLTPVSAQKNPVLKGQPVASLDKAECTGCTHAIPAAIYSSFKNALTIYGPPDGKGKPVEYQVLSQSRETGSWKFEAAGQVSKPGEQVELKYYQPDQLLVLIYCETPFFEMVTFSNARMSGSDKSSKYSCESCLNKPPVGIFVSEESGITVVRTNAVKEDPLEYHAFAQAKNKTWKFEKGAALKDKGEKVTSCLGKLSQALILVYGNRKLDARVKFGPEPCDK